MKDNQFMLVLFKEKEEVNMENVKGHDVVKLNIVSMMLRM